MGKRPRIKNGAVPCVSCTKLSMSVLASPAEIRYCQFMSRVKNKVYLHHKVQYAIVFGAKHYIKNSEELQKYKNAGYKVECETSTDY